MTRQKTPVVFSERQRLHHTHVIGATGKGKSKFLELLLRKDIRSGQSGLCLLDPHGSLYDDIVQWAAQTCPQLADRFILFNPAHETEVVLGFNPIPSGSTQASDYTVETLVHACLKAWGQDSLDRTPRITRWLENVFFPVIENRLTLLETLPLLSTTGRHRDARRSLVANVHNEAVAEDWEMFERSNVLQRQNLIEGAANRLRKFLRNAAIRNTLGQQDHAIDLERVMAENKILLVNLNGGNRISAENTKLLGIMMVNELFRVAKLRNPRDTRLRPFFLYIDEFANFMTRDIARALEECRKFRLFLVLAHQHLAQLKSEDEYLYASVMTNCLNRVVFGGLSKLDAELMADEISTGFVNLKAVKDEIYATKVRHREETRIVRGRSEGRSEGKNESASTNETHGLSQSRSQSEAHGQNWSRSETSSESVTHGRSIGETESRVRSRGQSETIGTSESQGRSRGQSEGRTETIGISESNGSSTTHGTSWNTSQGRSGSSAHQLGRSHTESHGASSTQGESAGHALAESHGASEGTGRSWRGEHVPGDLGRSSATEGQSHSASESSAQGSSRSATNSHNSSQGRSESTTATQGWNQSQSHGQSSSRAQSSQQTASLSEGRQTTASSSENENLGHSRSQAASATSSHSQAGTWTDSESAGTSTSRGRARGGSHTITAGESVSRSLTRGQAITKGTSQGTSRSRTQSIVPFLKPEQYRELTSRTFWSLAELRYMAVAAIKNQGVGRAFIKSGSNPPVETAIAHVSSVPYHPTLSPKRLATFRARVLAAHPAYYLPTAEACRQQEQRSLRVFSQPLMLDDEQDTTIEAELVPVIVDTEVEEESPFS